VAKSTRLGRRARRRVEQGSNRFPGRYRNDGLGRHILHEEVNTTEEAAIDPVLTEGHLDQRNTNRDGEIHKKGAPFLGPQVYFSYRKSSNKKLSAPEY
jgi:hypothetical protein